MTEFDEVRATVQALQGTATLLQGAMDRLGAIEQERQQAEQTLRTVTTQVDLVRSEQSGVLAEFERLVQSALSRRAALLAEITELEVRRDNLVVVVAPPPPPDPPAPPAPHADSEAPSVAAEPVLAEPEPVASEPLAVKPEPEPVAAQPEPVAAVREIVSVAPPAPRGVAPAPRGRRIISWRAVTTALLATLLLGMAVLLTPLTQAFGGLQLLAVMSGSMEPTIHVGGAVGVVPVQAMALQVGDVITFANQSNPDVLVTHRIVSIDTQDGQELLTTRGDANDAVDAVSVPANRAVGRVAFTMPWLGYAMVWLASPIAKIIILGISVLGLLLPSLRRPSKASSYASLEREIDGLLSVT
jgi:signal peptidase I